MWHTRHRAAVELKLSEVPCIYADDLNDEQIMGGRGASLGVSVKAKVRLRIQNHTKEWIQP